MNDFFKQTLLVLTCVYSLSSLFIARYFIVHLSCLFLGLEAAEKFSQIKVK